MARAGLGQLLVSGPGQPGTSAELILDVQRDRPAAPVEKGEVV